MLSTEHISRLRQSLENRRYELLDRLDAREYQRRRLQDPEPEIGESAQKGRIQFEIDRLGEREHAELHAIDAALRRMEEQRYGRCVACGSPIRLRRLEAIPWTPLCAACAGSEL